MNYWTIIDVDYNPVRIKTKSYGQFIVKADVNEMLKFNNLENAYTALSTFNRVIEENETYRIDAKLPLQIGVVEVDIKIYPQEEN